MLLYPLRLLYYIASQNSFDRWPSIIVPNSFDPAVLLYPPLLANYVSTLLSEACPGIILPNIILGVSSMLTELIPSFVAGEGTAYIHWLLSCLPLFSWQSQLAQLGESHPSFAPDTNIDAEILVLLYPMHRSLCGILRQIASTSLLETEVQLLSITLINLLLLSTSPQMIILKTMLWGGGLGLLLGTDHVFRWLMALERVPKWRFRRVGSPKHALKSQPKSVLKEPLGKLSEILHFDRPPTLDSEDEVNAIKRIKPVTLQSTTVRARSPKTADSDQDIGGSEAIDILSPLSRKSTGSDAVSSTLSPATHTPSGRKKRSSSRSLQRFYNYTETGATLRKWAIAGYIYVFTTVLILIFIRLYIQHCALSGVEPVGWALNYLFSNIPWFRMQVLTWGLEHWIPLPPYPQQIDVSISTGPWIAHLRHNFGTANTRLLLSAYLASILLTGLTLVIYLSVKPVSVDTRRKIFHFTMVLMLLPTTFIDPLYIAFALSLILAVFLLLDTFRACALPPISKPMKYFLAPYIDGRDLRGPVVVSHIFLLVGCAIPLWLSLATMRRDDENPWELAGEIEGKGREVAMLSGVICVGMGDAFASLIGRRFGKRKWVWPGGKTLEGSAAFAAAVAFSLCVVKAWLRFGGWEHGSGDGWAKTVGKSLAAGMFASTMEAVLTGGNDNVVVPVVFWCAVRGLGI